MCGYILIICQSVWLSNYSPIFHLKSLIIYTGFQCIVYCYPSLFLFIVHCHFPWLLLPLFCCCVSLLSSTVATLPVHCDCIMLCSVFQIVLECLSYTVSVLMFLFNWSHRYCLSVISVVLTCMLHLVTS